MSTELGPPWLATEKSEMFGRHFSLAFYFNFFRQKQNKNSCFFFFLIQIFRVIWFINLNICFYNII